jgi:hypothetical protein
VAQTWVGKRTRPHLGEIVAVDATGEPGWPYGQEDLAGDGLASFPPAEQAVDIRTVYVTTDEARLWVRVYVAAPVAVSAQLVTYLFLDTDENPATGGPALGQELNPKLTADPTKGGYEYVLELRGAGAVSMIWSWKEPQKKFVGVAPTPDQAKAEIGKDVDPIRLAADVHGYVEAQIDLPLVGLAKVCASNLYVRSVNEGMAGGSDLDVGVLVGCGFVDKNGDRVPDVVVTTSGCAKDAECPGGGICVKGACVLAIPCAADAECPGGERCGTDGVCIAVSGGACATSDTCGGRLCVSGTCAVCARGGSECGVDRFCGPDGLCIEVSGVVTGGVGVGAGVSVGAGVGVGAGGAAAGGYTVGPDERVQGGACACEAAGQRGHGDARGALFGLPLVGLLLTRRRLARLHAGLTPSRAGRAS